MFCAYCICIAHILHKPNVQYSTYCTYCMRTMYIQYSARRTYSTVHTIQYRDWIPIPRTHATQGGTKWPKVQQKTALQIKTRILAATSDRFILIVQEHGHGPAPWPMGHGSWHWHSKHTMFYRIGWLGPSENDCLLCLLLVLGVRPSKRRPIKSTVTLDQSPDKLKSTRKTKDRPPPLGHPPRRSGRSPLG
jgi:hypothetical protein